MMLKPSVVLCAILAVASAQSPFLSFSNGPSSSSPFGNGPPSSPFGNGPPSSSPFGNGPPSSSPFGNGPPSSSPFGNGPPGSRPGGRGPPPGFPSSNYKSRPNAPSKLFSWLGNTMSKFPGLPKLQYHSSKPKPGSHGPPGFGPSSSSQNAPPTYFSSGGPPRESLILPQIPNSVYDGSSSPFGGSSVSFAPSSNSIEHAQVAYRSPSGPPPGFSSGGPPSYSSGRPGPPSFSSGRPGRPGGPPPSYSSGRPGGPPPSFSSRPPPSYSSRPPPSYASGPRPSYSSGPQSFSSQSPSYSSSFESSIPSFSNSGVPFASPSYSSQSQGQRENLEVFPSQQISYQSQTINENQPGYDDALQNIYGSQSNSNPSYQSSSNNYQQQGSYSQNQPQVSNDGSNYGATFHTVRVAPMYDIGDHFKASPTDMSGSSSNQQQQQQSGNVHDTPFSTLVNEYSAQADAATAGSEQEMMSATLQNGDLAASASSSPIQGVQILGQSVNAEGNPVFEVVAGDNAPTYDGHPVDLNKLISMIEPGAQIDTLPQFNNDAQRGSASEQHPVYVHAPTRLDLESEAAMSSGISGNKKLVSGITQSEKMSNLNDNDNNDDVLNAMASESRPAILKLDGSRLSKGDDDKFIKEHFDKEIIFDDLQDNKDKGFIILGVSPDNETGHVLYSQTTNNGTGTIINNDQLLRIVQQLRNSGGNSGFSIEEIEKPNKFAQTPDKDSTVTTRDVTSTTPEFSGKTTQHPNHNYNIIRNSSRVKFTDDKTDKNDRGRDTPVINPIFDSVRHERGSISSSISTSISSSSDNDNNSFIISDDEDDTMFPDDMTIEDGDLAASASRNVKSVAIIVTPPPTYVKIKNKYKKVNGPVSSTSTPAPTSTSLASPPLSESAESDSNIDAAFSESLRPSPNRNENSSNIRNYDNDNSSITSTSPSSLQVDDSILKLISTISNTSSNNNGTTDGNQKRIRYPVYRGKSTSA